MIKIMKKEKTNFPRKLTFKVKKFKSGEWIAQCKEVGGILTGGMDFTKDKIWQGIEDAIISAMGIKIIIKSS